MPARNPTTWRIAKVTTNKSPDALALFSSSACKFYPEGLVRNEVQISFGLVGQSKSFAFIFE
jgi:hypothetical protein